LSKADFNVNDLIVIDTEGGHHLTEIAIINFRGDLVYEAFTENKPGRLNNKSLELIINDLESILENKTIICHSAQHDAKILINSFNKCGKTFPQAHFICTVELAEKNYPSSRSYSLKYLAKKLLLTVKNQYFNEFSAHRARYDAEFTLQLYSHLISMSEQPQLNQSQENPFSSNRVDNPFQNHLDLSNIYHEEFDYLCSILDEIKKDPNKQSRGGVIIGEAGSGKTHLIMRMAKAKLKTNRLLYIRHPNNPEAINHHIYSRILESFAHKVSLQNTQRTQFDLLLAQSFTKILQLKASQEDSMTLNKIIKVLEKDSLSLFERLGAEGTETNRKNWQFIETRITQWWEKEYSSGGYAPNILKGIIKFCMYKDNPTGGIKYKDLIRRWLAGSELEKDIIEKIGLNNWSENISKEEFALEAMRLFGQLSTLDEPLIIVFDQLESLINNPVLLINFGSALREILTHVPNSLIIVNLFPDRWQKFQEYFDASTTDRLSQHLITLKRPSNQDLLEMLQLKCNEVEISLENMLTSSEIETILQETSIRKVITQASHYFRYKTQNIPLPEKEAVTQLNQANCNEIPLEKRVQQLETIIQQIVNLCLPILNNVSTDTSLIPTQLEEIETNDNDNFDFRSEPNIPISYEPEKSVNTEKTSVPNPVIQSSANTSPSAKIFSKNPISSQKQTIISYLKEAEQEISLQYNSPHIITDYDDWGKLVQIVQAFKEYDPNIQTDQLTFGKRVLPEHLLVISRKGRNVIAFLHASGNSFTSRIKNFNELTTLNKHIDFTLVRDNRESAISGKVGQEEIDKLNYANNGQFLLMTKDGRISFELIYKMITDINEGDLEATISEGVSTFISKYHQTWLVKKVF
jgi:hypothetical protein